jgi:hypothetical protein
MVHACLLSMEYGAAFSGGNMKERRVAGVPSIHAYSLDTAQQTQ